MTNSKSTKRALVSSTLAILMCAAMLIGTTFAWFTDTASTAVNKIQAGNLNVDIVDENGESLDGKSLSFRDVNGATDILWEPGATFMTPAFKIKSTGSLALKYNLALNGITGDNILLDVIKFSVVKADGTEVDLNNFEGHLTPDAALSEALYIKGQMDETANNDYQSKTLEGIGITVAATQWTYEFDSKNDQYDKNAKCTEIIPNGKTFTGKQTLKIGITSTNPNAIAVKAVGNKADVTILDGAFDGGSGGNNQCVQAAEGAKVTIKGGTFTVGGDANGYGNSVIESRGGNIVIEGGFFKTDYQYDGRYYVLNQLNNNPGTITVKGGTFVNYDPSTGDDNLGGSFVADGYSVVTEVKANGDKWYTVVKGNVVKNNEETEAALGENKEEINVTLTEDTSFDVKPYAQKPMGGVSTKSIVIDGRGHKLTFNNTNSDWNNVTWGDAKLVIKNAVIDNSGYNADGGPWNSHDIYFNGNVELENVTFTNAVAINGKAVLKNVSISDENAAGETYMLWICAGSDVTLENVTINGKSAKVNGNRAIAIKDQYIKNPGMTTLIINGKNKISSDKKAAVLVSSKGGATITVNGTVDITGVKKDQTNLVWKDDASEYSSSIVTVTGASCITKS